MQYISLNGRLLEAKDAHISPQDRGFRYGDGVYATIAVHGGVPYGFDWHMARLGAGLEAVRITCDLSLLPENVRRLLRENRIADAILRIQVTRGAGGRGFLPDAKCAPTVIIETLPMPPSCSQPITLWQSDYAKVSPRALPVRYKLCQGMNSIMARMEAADHDCFDALLLNERSELCETSSANLFWLRAGALYTPSLACGALEGSMRHAVMRLSKLPVHEVEADLETLLHADAVFITNAVWKIVAVSALLPQAAQWPASAAVDELRRLVDDDIRRHCQAQSAAW